MPSQKKGMNGRGVESEHLDPPRGWWLLAIARASAQAQLGAAGWGPMEGDFDASVGRGGGVGVVGCPGHDRQRHLGRPGRMCLQLECLASICSRLLHERGGRPKHVDLGRA